ncbi:MAG: hypothetical protein IPP27_14515 [Bacteroidetes bacterium]|nr:hypothetical protein [Bacteroidota bacterium]
MEHYKPVVAGGNGSFRGSSYVLMGSSQLLSVPYALYAAQSASAPGDDWGTATVHTTSELNGNGTTGNPIGMAQQGATNGKVLKWNGTQWSPAVDSNTTYIQGTGISILGNIISNTGDVNAADDISNTTNANGDLTEHIQSNCCQNKRHNYFHYCSDKRTSAEI